jgi:hypothetical protein
MDKRCKEDRYNDLKEKWTMQVSTIDTNTEYVDHTQPAGSTPVESFFQTAGVTELSHTPDQQAYATILNAGHLEHWPLASRTFRLWLKNHLFHLSGSVPSDRMIGQLLNTMEGRALFDGAEHRVFVRIAEADDAIYLDLANDQWQAVEITADGWQVLDHPPIKFRRPRGMAPLPIPERYGSLDDLRRFINVSTEADWILLTSWLLNAFRPTGPYPILMLHGEQGSAKSTTTRVLRSLIDPNISPLRTVPRNERDLMIAASNSWVQAFDNLSHMPLWFADALCRLATGGGFATRKLRTDQEEALFEAQLPSVLTSLGELATRGDLMDRAIVINLSHIPHSKRRTLRQSRQTFEQARPSLLGAVLDGVSAALRNLQHVQLTEPPRMADFAEWSCAAAEACAWQVRTPEGVHTEASAFLHVYQENITTAQHMLLDTVIAPTLLRLVEHRPWSGTHTDLLDVLRTMVGARHKHELPLTARALSSELDHLIPSLRSIGMYIERKREGGTGQRLLKLWKDAANRQ